MIIQIDLPPLLQINDECSEVEVSRHIHVNPFLGDSKLVIIISLRSKGTQNKTQTMHGCKLGPARLFARRGPRRMAIPEELSIS
jgi:hypothetical protein